MQHAYLSPSAADRWMACHASVGMCKKIKADDDGSAYANEGSAYANEGSKAHILAARCLIKHCDATSAGGDFPDDMREYVQQYLEYVWKLRTSGHFKMLVERRIIYSAELWGTADCILINDEELVIIDFKYGQGLIVEAHENKQMLCYAMCALREFEQVWDFKTIRFIIFQPRREHISEAFYTPEDIHIFAQQVKTALDAIKSDNPQFSPSVETCRFCKASGVCKPQAEKALSGYTAEEPNLITPEQIGIILPKLGQITSWIKSIKERALKTAINGIRIPGFKLVEGRGRSQWAHHAEAELEKHPRAEDLFERKLIGITAAKKILGGKNEIFEQLTTKSDAAPALVPEDDKRHELNGVSAALNEFYN